ncbi:hypothetical protein F511_22689, partial [Dorcoceras hygrometricum]
WIFTTASYKSLGENDWYFFTSRERKYTNESRPDRQAGNGYWKATVGDKMIYDNHVIVGQED